MSYYEFTILLHDKVNLYIISIICSAIFYFFLYRNKIRSLLDPFLMAILASCIGLSVIIFLKLTENISTFFFYQYIFSQIAFLLGFFCNKYQIRDFSIQPYSTAILQPHKYNISKRYYYFFIATSSIYILLKLYTYKVVGIPLFLEYRLAAVGVGGGFGLINRIVNTFSIMTIYWALFFIQTDYKKSAKIVLSFYILFIILSGSKGSFLTLFQSIFVFLFINKDLFQRQLKIYNSKAKLFFLIAFIAAIGVLFISKNNLEEAIQALVFRIVSYGDTYYLAYPNNVISRLTSSDWWVALTGDLLRTIRLIPEEKALPGMGFEIMEIANHATNVLAGPNPRHNIFGYVHFGYLGGIIYSFSCGFIMSYIYKKFYSNSIHYLSQFRRMFLFIFYIAGTSIETDPQSFVSIFNNLIIIFLPYYLIENLFSKYSKIYNQ